MKNIKPIPTLFALAIVTGMLTYITSKFFTSGFAEILPLIVFVPSTAYFISALQKKNGLGLAILLAVLAIFAACLTFYLISLVYPLPTMIVGESLSAHTKKISAILGISMFVAGVPVLMRLKLLS